MIDHVSVEVADLNRSMAFYDSVLSTLGYERLATREATAGYGKRYPEFWINQRDNGGSASESGFHVALRCADSDIVQSFHREALAAGGACDSEPGPRPEYSEGYYAAFIRDPDGNRIEVVTFLKAENS